MLSIQSYFKKNVDALAKIAESDPLAIAQMALNMTDENQYKDFKIISLLAQKDKPPICEIIKVTYVTKQHLLDFLSDSRFALGETALNKVIEQSEIAMQIGKDGEIFYSMYDSITALYQFFNG